MSSSRPSTARSHRTAPHKVRIIGGRYKRTPLPVLDLPDLRPTPDRVRETLFNWLNHLWGGEFADKTVLDAFAGSGALGFEAASRGVAEAVLVETDRRAAASLEELRARLGAGNVSIVAGDARSYLARAAARYDLVLLDPPFGQDWLDRILPSALQALTNGGMLYIEAEAPIAAPPGTELLRQDKAGAVHFHLLRSLPETA
ncbi:16S rRNA (guanine(966)-N(2))-methyltransferase RsmD [Pigmentiphaga sp. H8]|uniref:16S rRNA (guanine(966)-N(2))-methyltransferase RsmD n=1 Tax=unclassified Pigmentiphaga TaxID=2626614 RepID=UPI000F5922FF|nr:16S rRNA (guanine(966)-N(2))-methyltransferase RsmD [Pigmentiphaga sp. H8]AZG06752.1 16S rRNA (guanine(966)-N(2))-methyltransferase RsmD [Pigmentiphaga sp. H8]